MAVKAPGEADAHSFTTQETTRLGRADRTAELDGGYGMPAKILCAVDDSEHSRHAVTVAAQLAKAMNANLTLLAVNQLLGGSGGKSAILAKIWEKEELGKILDGATAAAKQAGIAAPKTESIVSRDVGRAIVSFAEEQGVDHIVVGSGGKGAVSRLMIGSVSRDVVDRAHCPVTIAR